MRIRDKNRNVTLAFVVILPLCLASFAGNCKRKTTTTRTDDEIAVDNAINVKVRENLTASSLVRAIDIGMNTFKLKVTLDGSVGSEAEREEAIRITRQTEIERNGAKHKVKDVEAGNLKVVPR